MHREAPRSRLRSGRGQRAVQVELVAGGAVGADGGDGGGGGPWTERGGLDHDVRGGEVVGDGAPALVLPEPGEQPGVVAQPSERERDVRRAAAGVLGDAAVARDHDVDQGLADDGDRAGGRGHGGRVSTPACEDEGVSQETVGRSPEAPAPPARSRRPADRAGHGALARRDRRRRGGDLPARAAARRRRADAGRPDGRGRGGAGRGRRARRGARPAARAGRSPAPAATARATPSPPPGTSATSRRPAGTRAWRWPTTSPPPG